MPRPTFEVSEQTRAAYDLLDALRQGETCPYADLTAALGEDAQTDAQHHVAAARRMLLREKSRVYECVVGVGVKWLAEAEVAQMGPQSLRAICRKARRQSRKMQCLKDESGLSDDEKRRYRAHLAMLGFLQQNSSFVRRQEVERKAANAGLPATQDLRYLVGS